MRPAPKLAFVHAHPDDETLATGAAIAALSAAHGHPVVVTLTSGERGEVAPAALAEVEAYGLVAVRRSELASAAEALGADVLVVEGYSDSGMQWGEDGLAKPSADAPGNALSLQPTADVADAIVRALEGEWVEGFVTYDAMGGYGHPDHIAARAATIEAARRLDVPVYERLADDAPAKKRDVTYELAPVGDAVTAALGAYRSQLRVDGQEIVHVGGQRQAISRIERYREIARTAPTTVWTWVSAAVCLFLGAWIGAGATLVHQSVQPFGVILALVGVAAAMAYPLLTHKSRIELVAMALGVFAALAFLAFDPFGTAGPNAGPIVPENPVAWVFLIGTGVIVLACVAWPDAAARERIRLAAREGAPK